MPRIRSIKPEFWSSPSVAGADPWVRLLFIAMWNWADDHGRGTANPKELAAFAFPHDDDPGAPTSAELPFMLAEVADRWSVVFYEVGGRRYYAIPSWDDHQKNERRAKSRYPAPEEGAPYRPGPPDQRKYDQQRKTAEPSVQMRGTSVQVCGSSGTGTGEQGNRGTGEKTPSSEIADAIPDGAVPPGLEPEPRPDVEQLCTHLADLVEANTAKRPNVTKRWRDAARLLLDRDLAQEPDPLGLAMRVATWATNDEFWRANILSMPTLREKFTRLRLKARSEWERSRHPPGAQSVTARAVASVDAAFDEWEARNAGNVRRFPLREGA